MHREKRKSLPKLFHFKLFYYIDLSSTFSHSKRYSIAKSLRLAINASFFVFLECCCIPYFDIIEFSVTYVFTC